MHSRELAVQVADQVAAMVNDLSELAITDFLGSINLIIYRTAEQGSRCGAACGGLSIADVTLAAVSLTRNVVRALKHTGASAKDLDAFFTMFCAQSQDLGHASGHLTITEEDNGEAKPDQEDLGKDPGRRW